MFRFCRQRILSPTSTSEHSPLSACAGQLQVSLSDIRNAATRKAGGRFPYGKKNKRAGPEASSSTPARSFEDYRIDLFLSHTKTSIPKLVAPPPLLKGTTAGHCRKETGSGQIILPRGCYAETVSMHSAANRGHSVRSDARFIAQRSHRSSAASQQTEHESHCPEAPRSRRPCQRSGPRQRPSSWHPLHKR